MISSVEILFQISEISESYAFCVIFKKETPKRVINNLNKRKLAKDASLSRQCRHEH